MFTRWITGLSPSPGPVSGAEAQRAAQAELAHREYHQDDPSAMEQVVARVQKWLGNFFASVVHGKVSAVLIVLIVLCVVVAAAALVWRAGRPSGHGQRYGEDLLSPHDDEDHRRAALLATEQGRYGDALREWLRECARTLEARELLMPQPGRTGGELARAARQYLPDAAPALAAAAHAFDAIWFGRRAATANDAALGLAAAEAARAAPARRNDAALEYAIPS